MVASFGVVVQEGFTNPQTSQTIASALVILHNFTVRPYGLRHPTHESLRTQAGSRQESLLLPTSLHSPGRCWSHPRGENKLPTISSCEPKELHR